MYVEFRKNFLLADSTELMAVRLIPASWAQKRLIPTFYTWCTSSSWKIFFSPSRASSWLLDSFWRPEPKKFHSYFLDMMYVDFMKNFLLADWSELIVLDSCRTPEPKNVWFQLSRHDVRRVHEKFPSRRFDRADGCSTHFGILSPKTFFSYFLDMMYVEYMKNFLLADSSELMAVRLILDSWAQKGLIPTF